MEQPLAVEEAMSKKTLKVSKESGQQWPEVWQTGEGTGREPVPSISKSVRDGHDFIFATHGYAVDSTTL